MAQSETKKTVSADRSRMQMPHNLEAEKKVLGSLLLDRDALPEVSRLLNPEDFYQVSHQEIYRHIVELEAKNKPIDLTFLSEELSKAGKLDAAGGYLYLANLETSVLSTSAAADNAMIVQEKATLRRLITAAETITREAREESRDIQDIIEAAESEIYRVNRDSASGRFMPISEVMNTTLEEITHLYETRQPRSRLRTGMSDLDKLIGGFEPSALVILAARPSIGKTAFALNVVRNVATLEDKGVAFFSLEMGAEQLNMRLLCSEAKVPSHKIQRGQISEDNWKKVRETASRMMGLPIYIDDTPGLSIMQVRSRSRRLKAQHKNLGLIVVDYLQLMTGSSNNRDQNRQQEVAEISRGLKGLAKELNIPVLALSQLSRGIEQRSGKDKSAEPQLSDLRESGSIEQDADVVMFVHRERQETARDEDGKLPDRSMPIPTQIIVGKNRNGPIGRAEMLFIPDYTRFSDPFRDGSGNVSQRESP